MKEEIIYHYCSMENFYNIISSHSLWLNDAMQTNDNTEMKLVIDQFKI